MRHVRLVSKAPQAAITDLSAALQALILLLQVSSQVGEIVAYFESKKGSGS